MNTDFVYDIDAQKQWLVGSFTKPDYYHWIVHYEGKDVGFVNIFDWNPELKETFWGFHIGEDRALGMGGIVPP